MPTAGSVGRKSRKSRRINLNQKREMVRLELGLSGKKSKKRRELPIAV